MRELEVLIGLILAATLLAAVARRVGAPYPVFLAIGGALLAFVPGAPSLTVPPELALALFVAPILLDAAYDASPRDLKDNWVPLTGLVVGGGPHNDRRRRGGAHVDARHAMGRGDCARRSCRTT